MIINGNETFTAAEAAGMVGLSVNRFREIARAGDVKYYRPAGRRKMIFKNNTGIVIKPSNKRIIYFNFNTNFL